MIQLKSLLTESTGPSSVRQGDGRAAAKKDFRTIVLDYILDKANWTSPTIHCGFRECLTIPGIGEMVVKMDTGNGSKSMSIHGDKAEEKGKYLEWEINGKKFKDKIVGYANAVVGDKVEKRPIIEKDVVFAGKLVPHVHISVVDRKDKSTPALANRSFMDRLGIIVSPSKAFKATEFTGEYDPESTIGEVHGGIEFEKAT